MSHTTWCVTCNIQLMTHDTIIHDKVRDKKGTSWEKRRQTWKDGDKHGRTLTYRNGQGHTGKNTDIHWQTGTDMDGQGGGFW